MSRTAILDATEHIIREDGYAAVTSRKIAAQAGLKSQLVHYYFKTMDDVFLALFRRVEEQHFTRLADAAAARDPLSAIWKLCIDPKSPRLTKEFIALATHKDLLRHEIARSAERTRSLIVAMLTRAIEDRGLSATTWPPLALAVLMDGAARLIVSDTALGTGAGHAETIAFVERLLTGTEPN